MSIFIEPGVKTREIDFSTYVSQSSSTIVGMVGGATKGPLSTPVLCSSVVDFTNRFGKPVADDFGALVAVMFLRRGNQLWFTRVAEDTVAKASVSFDGADATEVAVVDYLTFTMLEEGTHAHSVMLEIANVDGMEFDLNVYKDEILSSSERYSLDSADEIFIGNIKSSLFEVEIGTGDAVKMTEASSTFAGGEDGLPVLKETVVTGLGTFADPSLVDINVLTAPGRYEGSVVEKIIEICENRADCIGIIDPPQASGVQGVVDYHNGTSTEIDAPIVKLDTSFASIYYPWVQIRHPFSGELVWAPPSSVVAGVYSYNDQVAEPWFAPSGLNRGKVDFVQSTEDEGENYDLLFSKGNAINSIINYKKRGFVVWGQFTLQRKNTSTNRVNVRRCVSLIRKLVNESSERFVFEPNDEFTWNQWKDEVEPHLVRIQNDRGIYDYKIIMDETTMNSEAIDRNEMLGQVAIKPTKTAEYILIDFVIRATGDEM